MSSILTAAIITVVLALSSVLAGAGIKTAHQHAAQTAADISAVAGAYALYQGHDACQRAREVAAHNDATMVECTIVDHDVIVSASLSGHNAQAKAGPL